MKKILLLVCAFISFEMMTAQITFTENTTSGLTGKFQGSIDSDGSMIITTGFVLYSTDTVTFATDVYKMIAGMASLQEDTDLINIHSGFGLVGELGGSNAKDFAVVGATSKTGDRNPQGRIYLSNSSGGHDMQVIMGVSDASGFFADLDNDGDDDLVYQGKLASGKGVIYVYRNENGTFILDWSATDSGRSFGALGYGDIDSDGKIDFISSGITNYSSLKTDAYINTSSGGTLSFTLTTSNPFPGVAGSSHGLVDLNGDTHFDTIIFGSKGGSNYAGEVCIGNGLNVFTSVGNLPGKTVAASAYDDVDEDGDMDVYVLGQLRGGYRSFELYLNDGNANFTLYEFSFPGNLADGMIHVMDVDGDGKPDVIYMGSKGNPPFAHGEVYVFHNTTDQRLSINDLDRLGDITIYPNPASEFININNSSSTQITNIEIYSLAGVKVYSLETDLRNAIQEVNIQGLAPGIYLLNIRNKESAKTYRFIKQ
ncbi:MAG: hypothetical protein ACI870_000477 [Crocinitomicaceae bacterium]|jgi:hypothetical protein